jgi:hypothetical protein
MFLLNNIKVSERDQRTIGDTQYPPDWFLDPLERDKVGMVEVPTPSLPDDNLYTSVENPDGSYTATPRTAADLQNKFIDANGTFILKIDADADALIRAVIGERASQYESAEREALAYKAAGYTGTVPPKVQAWATAKNQTARWAADSQIETAEIWRNAENDLYAKRLLLKEQTRNTTDITELDLIKSDWDQFMGLLRTKF